MAQGFGDFARQLEEASRAFQSLVGEIASVRIVPGDQASVQAAIREMETAIDRKAAPCRGNPLVDAMVTQMKAKYRERLIKRSQEQA